MTSKELQKKFDELQMKLGKLKIQFRQAKASGNKEERLKVREVLRATTRERNYVRRDLKLAKQAEGVK